MGIDKDFKDTALETYEELGIERKDIKVLGQLDTYVLNVGTIIESYKELRKKLIKI